MNCDGSGGVQTPAPSTTTTTSITKQPVSTETISAKVTSVAATTTITTSGKLNVGKERHLRKMMSLHDLYRKKILEKEGF